MADSEQIRKEYRELAETHNKLAIKHNKAVAESKKQKALLDIYESYITKFNEKLTQGWPRALSGIVGIIKLDEPSQIEIIYLKSLIVDFEKLILSDTHDRNEEIILAHLIGKALYTYIKETSVSGDDCETLLEMMTQYLNTHSRYTRVESLSLAKHFDGRYHQTDDDVQEMEQVQLASFLIWDGNSGNILRKALVTV